MDETLHKATAGAVSFGHTQSCREVGLKPGRRGKSCNKNRSWRKPQGRERGKRAKFGGKIKLSGIYQVVTT